MVADTVYGDVMDTVYGDANHDNGYQFTHQHDNGDVGHPMAGVAAAAAAAAAAGAGASSHASPASTAAGPTRSDHQTKEKVMAEQVLEWATSATSTRNTNYPEQTMDIFAAANEPTAPRKR